MPTVRPEDLYQLVIDLDATTTTGDPLTTGGEILLQIDGASMTFFLGRWNGTPGSYTSFANTATVGWGSGPVVTLSRAELQQTTPTLAFQTDMFYFGNPDPTALPTGGDPAPNTGPTRTRSSCLRPRRLRPPGRRRLLLRRRRIRGRRTR